MLRLFSQIDLCLLSQSSQETVQFESTSQWICPFITNGAMGHHHKEQGLYLYFCLLCEAISCEPLYSPTVPETKQHLSFSAWSRVAVREQCRSAYVLNSAPKGRQWHTQSSLSFSCLSEVS